MSDRIEYGDPVRVKRGGGNNVPMGIYYLYNTDDYYMAGIVQVKDAQGNLWEVDASMIEAVDE